jgi:hypothetical protein
MAEEPPRHERPEKPQRRTKRPQTFGDRAGRGQHSELGGHEQQDDRDRGAAEEVDGAGSNGVVSGQEVRIVHRLGLADDVTLEQADSNDQQERCNSHADRQVTQRLGRRPGELRCETRR